MEKIERYSVPETKEGRVQKLEEAKKTLKSEFVGLDEIIDKICDSIVPWYITPEIIVRPTIVSLWGMTGTGKTSIVRRLTALLGLSNKTVFFDCGEENNSGTETVASKIADILNLDEENNPNGESVNDFVFVFDEFQHARTINEHGEEVDKPNLRSIWNLLDSGLIRSDEGNWETSYFCGFVEDFENYVDEFPNVPINKGVIERPEDVEHILSSLGFFYYDRGVPGLDKSKPKYVDIENSENDSSAANDMLRPLPVIDDRVFRAAIRRLKAAGCKQRTTEIIKEFQAAKSNTEMLQLLLEIRKAVIAPKEIDCNKSIIFILGNLDEAFKVEGDINPDIDADIFFDETSKVSITDIKRALKKRFRAEQIARFGNSIIKYPTLKREHFEKVIEKEITRVSDTFTKTSGIDLEIDKTVYDLIYSEGVYPVQGVRPIYTTINTIFTPLMSDIVMTEKKGGKAKIEVLEPEKGYKQKTKKIRITGSSGKYSDRVINLILGDLRRPDSKKTRYINAVHETGHAIVMSYLTGKLPTAIVAISSTSGGFCITYDPDKTGEIRCRRDIDNDVMISLAGYLAEEKIYPDPSMRLLGSGNDISEAWGIFSSVAYEDGYFEPFSYSNYETYSGTLPDGMSDDNHNIKKRIETEFDRFRERTTRILEENRDLLIDVALKLGEVGEMSEAEFLEFIRNNKTGTLTEDRLKESREENSTEYYKAELLRLRK